MAEFLKVYFPSPLYPVGPNAQDIYNLFLFIAVFALIVFIGVAGAVVYAAFRFRAKPGDPEPRQVQGNNALETAWTIIPFVILAVIFVASMKTFVLNLNPPASVVAAGGTTNVQVVGRQWFWQFHYVGTSVTTTKTLTVPAGSVVKLSITSADVIHSFAVPQLLGRLDAIPGQVNYTWFIADRSGTWVGQCTEFCGVGHYTMLIRVTALPPGQFQAWLAAQEAAASKAGTGSSG